MAAGGSDVGLHVMTLEQSLYCLKYLNIALLIDIRVFLVSSDNQFGFIAVSVNACYRIYAGV